MKCESVDHFPDSNTRAQYRMKRLWRAAQRGIAGQLAIAALVVLPVRATAEDPPAAPPAAAPNVVPPAPPETPPGPPDQVIEAGSVPVTSSGENGTPGPDDNDSYAPPEEQRLPPPPDEDAPRIDNPGTQLTASPPQAPPVDGQWVYTSQYGWVWMPYSQSYTYVPNDGYPSMYLYGPTFGWRWVAAPWVFDYGPTPYWGNRGRASFLWYSRPWFARRAYVGPRYSYGPRYYYGGRPYARGYYRGDTRGYYRGDNRGSYRGGGGGRREVHVNGGGGHSHGGGGHSHGGGGRR